MKVAGLYQSAAKTHTMRELVKDAETKMAARSVSTAWLHM